MNGLLAQFVRWSQVLLFGLIGIWALVFFQAIPTSDPVGNGRLLLFAAMGVIVLRILARLSLAKSTPPVRPTPRYEPDPEPENRPLDPNRFATPTDGHDGTVADERRPDRDEPQG